MSRFSTSTGFAAVFVLVACGADPIGSDEMAICAQPPADLAVPIDLSREGVPLHWALGDGCIAITHDGLTAAQLAEVEAALDAWAAVGCSALCFEAPALSSTPVEDALDVRRIHFVPAEDLAAGETSRASIYFAEVSGRIVAASIETADGVTPGELVAHVGRVLGLGLPALDTDSVLAVGYPLAADSAPTELDAESLCVLYGAPPLCDD